MRFNNIIGEYLLHAQVREPIDIELDYFEHSIKKAAIRNDLTPREYKELLTAMFHQAGVDYGIETPEEFAPKLFAATFKIHYLAAKIFADHIFSDERAAKMLCMNGERIVEILKTREVTAEEFSTKVFDYLISTPLLIDFDQEFNAAAGINTGIADRFVYFHMGISDSLNDISKLIAHSNASAFENRLVFHGNHGHFNQYLSNQSAFISLLNPCSAWKKDHFFAPKLSIPQTLLASNLSALSECWVLFHEYAHLFLGNFPEYFTRQNPGEVLHKFQYEFICDEIATRVLVKADRLASVASELALYIIYYSNDTSETREDLSHPSVLGRLNRIQDITGAAFGTGISRINNLIEIPYQFMQNRFFMKETLAALGKRVDNFFSEPAFPAGIRETEAFDRFIKDINEKGFSLPVNSPEFLTTIIKDDEGNVRQMVYVKTTTLFTLFSSALANLLWPENPMQFTLNFLSFIVCLSDDVFKIPSEAACFIFNEVVEDRVISKDGLTIRLEQSNIKYTKEELEAGFRELTDLGILDCRYEQVTIRDIFIEINPY